MTRKTTWKEVHLPNTDDIHHLESYHQSSRGEFDRYTIVYEWGLIETNLPWSLFRKWFSYAGVKMPRDILTADIPSWEMYKDD